MIVHFLHTHLKLPVLGLVDYNPFGVAILMTYMHGSVSGGLESFKYGKNRAFILSFKVVPTTKWVGLHYKDIVDLNLPKQEFSQRDNSTLDRILSYSVVQVSTIFSKLIIEK